MDESINQSIEFSSILRSSPAHRSETMNSIYYQSIRQWKTSGGGISLEISLNLIGDLSSSSFGWRQAKHIDSDTATINLKQPATILDNERPLISQSNSSRVLSMFSIRVMTKSIKLSGHPICYLSWETGDWPIFTGRLDNEMVTVAEASGGQMKRCCIRISLTVHNYTSASPSICTSNTSISRTQRIHIWRSRAVASAFSYRRLVIAARQLCVYR